MTATLLVPCADHLDAYVAALHRGWSPDNVSPAEAAARELAAIERDPQAYLASLEDREGRGAPVVLPDGSTVKRLPWFRRWIWDGAFCGVISLRWQHGTEALPPHCLGHCGYAVVPWQRGRGLAGQALAALLPEAWALGLRYLEVTTDEDNVASQRSILAAGGVLHERFVTPPAFGGTPALRYRIHRDR